MYECAVCKAKDHLSLTNLEVHHIREQHRFNENNILEESPNIKKNSNFNLVCQTIGVENNEINFDVKTFPNPVVESFSLAGLLPDKKYKIQLYDFQGRTIHFSSRVINETTININTGNLLPGLFIISISNETGIILTKRFVKI